MENKVQACFFRSFAKINLGIEVLGLKPDGYHEIRTLFQTIDMHDTLEFIQAPPGRVSLEGDDPSIPWDENNLIYRAADLLRQRYSVKAGVMIRVKKVIPAGAGLGGGSSNAAVTLMALNKLWELNLPSEILAQLAREIGADVPFFLTGGLCLGEGRGDLISPLPELPPLPCLIVLPSFSVSTAEIYGYYRGRPSLTYQGEASRIKEFLERRRFSRLVNELEPVIFEFYPGLREIKSLLLHEEALVSLVSGTGSAVFSLFWEKSRALRAQEVLSQRGRVVLTETLPRIKYRQLLC